MKDLLLTEMKRYTFSGTPDEIGDIGNVIDITKLKFDDVTNYYESYYRPSNALLYSYGNLITQSL